MVVLDRIFNKRLSESRILMIGDVMLDQFLFVASSDRENHRIYDDIEYLHEVIIKDGEWIIPGGIARVAANVGYLGANASCVSIVGNDYRSSFLERYAKEYNFETKFLKDDNRPTTLKLRICSAGNSSPLRVLLRVDIESRESLRNDVSAKIIEQVREIGPKSSAIFVKDFDKGTITHGILKHISEIALNTNIPLIVSPKYHWEKYKEIKIDTVVCSFEQFVKGSIEKSENIDSDRPDESMISNVLESWPNINKWVVVCGEQGTFAWSLRDNRYEADYCYCPVATTYKNPEKIIGYNTAFTAGFIAGYISLRPFKEIIELASLTAGIQAQKGPCELVTTEDIRAQVFHPTSVDLPLVKRAYVANVLKVVDEIFPSYCIEEFLPGMVGDPEGVLEKNADYVEVFIHDKSQPQLLVLGSPGSGKTTLVEKVIEKNEIKYKKFNTPQSIDNNKLETELVEFIKSEATIALLDEFLAREESLRTLTGSLPSGNLCLNGNEIPLNGKKIIATGSASTRKELTDDIRSRFEPRILEIRSLTDLKEIVNIFCYRILKNFSNTVKINYIVLVALLFKARDEKENDPRNILSRRKVIGWGDDIGKKAKEKIESNIDERIWAQVGFEEKFIIQARNISGEKSSNALIISLSNN